MNSLKAYLMLLIANFTKPDSYKKWLILPTKHVYKFFTASILLIGLINGAIFSIKQIPTIIDNYLIIQDEVFGKYPDDLTINWTDKNLKLLPTENYQTLNLNLKELAVLGIENDLFVYYRANQLPEKEQQSLVNQNNTLLLINDQQLSFKTETNDTYTRQLSELIQSDDFIITKEDLPSLKEAITQDIFDIKPIIQLALPIFFAIANLASVLFSSIFYSFFLWVLLKISPFTIRKWHHVWRLTLTIMVTVNSIELALKLVYPNQITNIRELAFWLIVGYILLSWKFPKYKIKQV